METERAVVEDEFAAGELLHGEVLFKIVEAKGSETFRICQQRVSFSTVTLSCVKDLEMAVGVVELKYVFISVVSVVEHQDLALDSHEQTLFADAFLSASSQCVDGGQLPIAVEFAVLGMLQQITTGSQGKQDGDKREEYFETLIHVVSYLFIYYSDHVTSD